jgi:hypothetical protein
LSLRWRLGGVVSSLVVVVELAASCRPFDAADTHQDASATSGSDDSGAGTEAGSAASGCSGAHREGTLACIDFDGTDPFANLNRDVNDRGAVETTGGKSLPNAASFTVHQGNAVGVANTLFRVNPPILPGTKQRILFAFDARMPAPPTVTTAAAYFIFGAVLLGYECASNVGAGRGIQVEVIGPEGRLAILTKGLAETLCPADGEFRTSPSDVLVKDLSGWHHYELRIARSNQCGGAPATPSAQLFVDEKPSACATLGIDPLLWTQEVLGDFGVIAAGPSVEADATVVVDNVTLTVD